jgi:transcriptional regulator NrdR family protein
MGAALKTFDSNGIHCPHCSQGITQVMDSRPSHIGIHEAIRRRRRCRGCNYRFSTFEIPETTFHEMQSDRHKIISAQSKLGKILANLNGGANDENS